MKRFGVIVLIALLLVPVLAASADARGWRHGGHYRGGGGFFLGLGVGALLTAPWWYRPSYVYPAPVYVYPQPAYSYPAYIYGPPTYYPSPAYPAPSYYPSPAYPAPSYTTPTPQPIAPPPPGGAEAAPPPPSGSVAPQSAPSVSSQNCQTVWVEGHYETRVMPNGQRVTSWLPAQAQQLCQ